MDQYESQSYSWVKSRNQLIIDLSPSKDQQLSSNDRFKEAYSSTIKIQEYYHAKMLKNLLAAIQRYDSCIELPPVEEQIHDSVDSMNEFNKHFEEKSHKLIKKMVEKMVEQNHDLFIHKDTNKLYHDMLRAVNNRSNIGTDTWKLQNDPKRSKHHQRKQLKRKTYLDILSRLQQLKKRCFHQQRKSLSFAERFNHLIYRLKNKLTYDQEDVNLTTQVMNFLLKNIVNNMKATLTKELRDQYTRNHTRPELHPKLRAIQEKKKQEQMKKEQELKQKKEREQQEMEIQRKKEQKKHIKEMIVQRAYERKQAQLLKAHNKRQFPYQYKDKNPYYKYDFYIGRISIKSTKAHPNKYSTQQSYYYSFYFIFCIHFSFSIYSTRLLGLSS